MKVIGLTGGIGTGKSTTCRIIKEIDPKIIIIDADILSHKATQKGKLPYFILKTLILPKDCFHPLTGELIRSRLAELIFAQTDKSKLLKKIVERCIHPWVIYRMISLVIWSWICGEERVVLDIPLLFEGNLQWICSRTVLIDTSDPEAQLERILKRNPEMSEAQARNRISAQFPMEKKRKIADLVIKNDGNLVHLREALEKEFIGKSKNIGVPRITIFILIITLISIYISFYYEK